LVEAQGAFLNGPVLRWRCSRSDPSVAYRFSSGIDDDILENVDAAIVAVEERITFSVFKAAYGRSGMNRGGAAVSPDDQIRNLAEDVTPTSIAIEIVGKQAEALE